MSHYFPPEGNAPATRTYQHCKKWVSEGHQVTVITCAPNVPNGKVYDGYKNLITQKENIDGIKVLRVWTFLAANKGKYLRIINYISFAIASTIRGIFIKNPDVIVATSPQFFCGWAGVILAKIRLKKIVLEIRDIWPSSIATVGSMQKGIIFRLLSKLELLMYKLSDHIITVGEGYKEEILKKNTDPGKISVIPNGSDFDNYNSTSSLKSEHNNKKIVKIGYVGTIGMASGLSCVLDAAEIFQKNKTADIQFLFVGDGAMREDLMNNASKRKLNNVEFMGLIPKEKIPIILNTIDVCLIHLKDEPLFRTVLPSKMFEAFALGKPIILGVLGEAEKILKEAKAGVIMYPENTESLINCIDQMRSELKRKEYGENGRNYAMKHYDRNKLASKYIEILKKVVK